MKLNRKILSLVLALVMVLGLATTAFAAQEGTLTGGSITINDAVPGQTYNIYQILYLESYSHNADGTATGAYAYKANSAWENWLRTQTDYVSFDAQGYVTWVENADVAAFAKLAQVEAAKMTADATATAPAAAEDATYSTVKFENLKLGYYLVDTTLGTLCSLDTTNPSVEMCEKNEKPSVDKQVEEDSDNSWGDSNDADIGQTVNFKTTVKAYKGAQNYVVHDVMAEGLTFNSNSVKVTVGNTELTKDTDYTVSIPGTETGEGVTVCTFEIKFKQIYLNTITGTPANPTEIVITYSATLNENAKIGLDGNLNKTKLDYGDGSSTEWDETKTYTWDLDILKYANGDESKVLKDAKFVLLNKDKNKVATIVNGKLTGWVDVPAAGGDGSITWPDNTVLTTGENGKIEIDGLDADTYYLREVQAPAGYNKLADDVTVTITGATVKEGATEPSYITYVAKVNNQSGTELPSTGGMGTTIFYVLGFVLVAGAAVLLITKKRMSAAA